MKTKTSWNKGLHWSKEIRDKISNSKKGKLLGENNPTWKGDLAGYGAMHNHIRKYNKKSGICYFCKENKKTEWALKKGRKYSRNIEDYHELCILCHMRYDNPGFKKGHIPWMKGRKQSKELIAKRVGYGEDNHKAKLNKDDVAEIRILYNDGGITWQELADMFSVAKSTIGSILNKTNWKHI